MATTDWEPRWQYRVRAADGRTLVETENYAEARYYAAAHLRPLEQLWARTDYEWRTE